MALVFDMRRCDCAATAQATSKPHVLAVQILAVHDWAFAVNLAGVCNAKYSRVIMINRGSQGEPRESHLDRRLLSGRMLEKTASMK